MSSEKLAVAVPANIAKGIEVEILTTCVKQFTSDWNKNHYKPGNYLENGITVKRFKVRKRNTEKFVQFVS